jgi:hypothetical protein
MLRWLAGPGSSIQHFWLPPWGLIRSGPMRAESTGPPGACRRNNLARTPGVGKFVLAWLRIAAR